MTDELTSSRSTPPRPDATDIAYMELAVEHFNYKPVAEQAGISDETLAALERSVRAEFPDDAMMFELHVLRSCMAVRDGLISMDDLCRRTDPADEIQWPIRSTFSSSWPVVSTATASPTC